MDTQVLQDLERRLKKVGVEVQYTGNFPWVYMTRVNGKRVEERFLGNHGFTVAFVPKPNEKMKLTDIREIFKIVRKYK